MAFFYVKYDPADATDGQGTATGDGGRTTVQRTGAWSVTTTEFYKSIEDAVLATTPPVAGDYIFCSNLHDYDYPASLNINIPSGVFLISVDDANQEQYLRGAGESGGKTNVSQNLHYYSADNVGSMFFRGFDFQAGFNLQFTFGTRGMHYLDDCSLTIHKLGDASAQIMVAWAGGQYARARNCTFNWPNDTTQQGYLHLSSNAMVDFENCTFTGDFTNRGYLGQVWSGDRVGHFKFNNADFSVCTGLTGIIKGADTTRRAIITGNRILVPSGVPLMQSGYNVETNHVKVSSIGSSNEYYTDEEHMPEGIIDVDINSYLNSTYDGTTGFSTVLSTNANASFLRPLRYKLCAIPAQDLTTTKTLFVEFLFDADGTTAEAVAGQLATGEFWLEAVQNDPASHALGKVISSRPADVLSPGVQHTASSAGGWVGEPAGAVDYVETLTLSPVIDLDTDSGLIELWVCLGIPNATVNVCPAVSIS